MTNDPSNSKLVVARLPSKNLDYGLLALNGDTGRKLAKSGRFSAIAEYMGLIFKDEVLENPTAIFQGIKRPYINEGLDNFVYAYVCNPIRNYYYAPRDRFEGTGPHEDGPPHASVFTVFVSLARSLIDASSNGRRPPDIDIRGVILSWEWTLASSKDPRLPAFYQDRYRRTVWKTQ